MSWLQLTACSVDLDRGQLADGREGRLTPRELALLVRLVRQPGGIVGRGELMALFGYAPAARSRAIDKAMNTLRTKVEVDGAVPDHLLTVRGEGYVFHHASSAPARGSAHQAASTTPHPPVRTPFVGREREIQAFVAALGPRTGIHLVTGEGGIGKTRFAREVVARRGTAFGTDPVWVDLRAARSEVDLCMATAQALGVGLRDAPPMARLGSVLASRPTPLVVFDNAERVARGLARAVATWREQAPEATFLCTSRRMVPLQRLNLMCLTPLSPPHAASLLTQLADRPVQADVAPLLGDLGGNPLAIELAAAQLRIRTVAEVRTALAEGDDLVLDEQDRPTCHRSLSACLDATWQWLSPSAQEALAAVAAFAGDVEPGDARALLLRTAHPAPVDALFELLDAHVLVRSGKRLTMSVPMRAFARRRTDPLLWARAEVAHANWTVDRLGGMPCGAGALDVGAPTAEALPEIWLAHARARARGDHRTELVTAIGASRALANTGPFDVALRILDDVQGHASGLVAATLHRCRGQARELLGDAAGALEDYRAATEVARGWLDHARHGDWAHLELARSWLSVGRLDADARDAPQMVIDLLGPLASRSGLPSALVAHAQHLRAQAALNAGQADLAVRSATQACTSLGHHGLQHMMAYNEYTLGCALRLAGELTESQARLEQAVRTFGDLGVPRWEAACRRALATLWADTGQNRRSRDAYLACLATDRHLGNRPMELYDLCNLGDRLRVLGDLRGAIRHFGEARRLACAVGNQSMECLAVAAEGSAQALEGRFQRARDAYRRAEALTQRAVVSEEFRLQLRGARCSLALDTGDLAEAWRHLDSLPPVYPEDAARRAQEGVVAALRARHAALAGDHQAARQHSQQAVAMGTATNRRRVQAAGWAALGLAYQCAGRAEAVTAWQRARDLSEAMQDAHGVAQSLCGMSEAFGPTEPSRQRVAERAASLAREARFRPLLARALLVTAEQAMRASDHDRAMTCLVEAEGVAVELDLQPPAWLSRRLCIVRAEVGSGSVRDP